MDLMYRDHELIELSAGSVLDQEMEEVSKMVSSGMPAIHREV